MFRSGNSPVSTPPPDVDRVNKYSRHSRDENHADTKIEEVGERSPPSGTCSPVPDQGKEPTQGAELDCGSEEQQVSPTSVKENKMEVLESNLGTSPRTSAKLKLDELVSEHSHLLGPVTSDEKTIDILQDSRSSDRAFEFENLVDTDESSTEPPTSSTASLLDENDTRYHVC